MAKRKSAFSLELGEFNGKVTFKDIAELQKWHQDQREFFSWIGQVAGQNKNLSGLWNHLNQKWKQIDQWINQARPHEGTDQEESQFTALSNQTQGLYAQNQLLSNASPRAKFIEELRESDSVVAAFVLNYYLGLGIQPNDYKALEGAFVALQFHKGIKSNISAEQEALKDLRNKWQEELNVVQEDFSKLSSEEASLIETHQKKISELEKTFEEAIKTGQEKLNDIAESYDQKMALQSSVDYWGKKKTAHDKLAKIFGYVSLSTGIVVSIILGIVAYNLLEGIEKPEFWRLGILAVLASFGVWAVRILVRIFLSNLHLSSDADERITMIKTYIAMLREGQGPADGDRQLALQAMFRPSQIGLVKDEAAPPTVIDVVTKFAGKK